MRLCDVDEHQLPASCQQDEFHRLFWHRFQARFPALGVELSTDECGDLLLKTRSPFRADWEELGVLISPAHLGSEIIVWFGGGNVHCGYGGDGSVEAVIAAALDAA